MTWPWKVGVMYEDVYSALYQSTLRRWRDEGMASWMTACGLAGAVCANLALIVGFVVAMYGPLAPAWPGRPLAGLAVVGILLGNYAAFIRNNRYRQVVARFQGRGGGERKRVVLVAWVYVVASYVTPFLFAVTMSWLQARS